MVWDVKVHFIEDFQHAAIDVNIEMGIHKGPVKALVTPNKLLEIDPLKGFDCDQFTYWAESKCRDETMNSLWYHRLRRPWHPRSIENMRNIRRRMSEEKNRPTRNWWRHTRRGQRNDPAKKTQDNCNQNIWQTMGDQKIGAMQRMAEEIHKDV